MPTSITLATGLKNTNFVANTSRYINSTLIYWGNQNVLTFETYKRQPLVFSSSDRYLVVKPGEEFRPDLIAGRAYGNGLISLGWRIMEANLVFDVFDLRAGLTLRVPSIV